MALEQDRQRFEQAASAVQGELALAGTMAIGDGVVRADYIRRISSMVQEIRHDAEAGRISWGQAAEKVKFARDTNMALMRARTSPIGLARAQQYKLTPPSLNALVADKTLKRFGPGANWNSLTNAERNLVYADVIAGGARANPLFTAQAARLSRIGRGLLLLSLAVSIYDIYEADDKVDATGREVAVTGGGVLGGIAGGALAGLACGPGAPVCVTIGVFVAGGLAAMGVDHLWLSGW